VPLLRYFLFVGSALLALLFLADWYWPAANSDDRTQEASLDKQILRIRSAQKWPQKVVIDTSIPTIVPPPALVANVPPPPPPPPSLAAAALNKSVLNAHGEVSSVAQPQTPPRKTAAVRHRIPRPAPPRIDTYPVASAWSPWW
jgi:hypothetical protein